MNVNQFQCLFFHTHNFVLMTELQHFPSFNFVCPVIPINVDIEGAIKKCLCELGVRIKQVEF